jgi:hypothetical protein
MRELLLNMEGLTSPNLTLRGEKLLKELAEFLIESRMICPELLVYGIKDITACIKAKEGAQFVIRETSELHNVTEKLMLIKECIQAGVPMINFTYHTSLMPKAKAETSLGGVTLR